MLRALTSWRGRGSEQASESESLCAREHARACVCASERAIERKRAQESMRYSESELHLPGFTQESAHARECARETETESTRSQGRVRERDNKHASKQSEHKRTREPENLRVSVPSTGSAKASRTTKVFSSNLPCKIPITSI